MVSEQLFTDEDAAKFLEQEDPGVAKAVYALVYRGQTPEQITRYIARRFPGTILIPLIMQAAHHYQKRWI